jgi:hypothetical protein
MNAVGKCDWANQKYMELRQAMCGSYYGGESGLATGLESMWVLLFIVSLTWFPLSLCLCQAVKHSQQAQYGHRALLERSDSGFGEGGPPEFTLQVPLADPAPGDALAAGSSRPLTIRMTLDGPYAGCGLEDFRLEVIDDLATCLDIAPKRIVISVCGPKTQVFLRANRFLFSIC